jgi:hypothetical protein
MQQLAAPVLCLCMAQRVYFAQSKSLPFCCGSKSRVALVLAFCQVPLKSAFNASTKWSYLQNEQQQEHCRESNKTHADADAYTNGTRQVKG